MCENVVAALLASQLWAKDETRCRQNEDDFYEEFAHPAPRWFTAICRCFSWGR